MRPDMGDPCRPRARRRTAQLTLTGALRLAPVALVMPMDYTSLLWAVLLGSWIFGELPTAWTWIGAPIIIASGLVIVWREHRLAPPCGIVGGGRCPHLGAARRLSWPADGRATARFRTRSTIR